MKVLLAIDDSPGSQAAIQAVCKRAGKEKAQVKVLHVVQLPFSANKSRVIVSDHTGNPAKFGLLLRELSKRAEVLVGNAVGELKRAGAKAAGSVKYGDPQSVILDEAAEWKANLIVVGAHRYTGLERFFMGSVSEAVARHAACSVEIVRMQKKAAA